MKTAVVLLALLLHACAAKQAARQTKLNLDDDVFLESLLNPGDAGSGLLKDNPSGVSGGSVGGGTQQGKVKCSSATDTDSLSPDDFLALLTGDCDPVDPTPELGQTCERGEFQCTPYHRCREEDIYSDGKSSFNIRNRIGLEQYESEQEIITHSDCPRFGDVCCANPLPGSEEPEPPYVPQCGRRNQEGLGARIIGFKDSESQFGEFPWVVVVLQFENIDGEERLTFVCAGSLVHPQVVLTAAHSVAKLSAGARLVVRLGEWDTQHESELHLHEDIAVGEVKVHSEFHPTLLRDDVALLLLERPAQLRSHIDTLCLPSPGVNYDGAQCVTAGWGKDAMEGGVFQTVLKSVDLPHVPRAACQLALRKVPQLNRYFRLDRSFTCAGGTAAGEDACKGDGGAPLACRDPQQDGRWVQLGVVSWGVGCGQVGRPGVYADVRGHVAWIDGVISKMEPPQPQPVNLSIFARKLNQV